MFTIADDISEWAKQLDHPEDAVGALFIAMATNSPTGAIAALADTMFYMDGTLLPSVRDELSKRGDFGPRLH